MTLTNTYVRPEDSYAARQRRATIKAAQAAIADTRQRIARPDEPSLSEIWRDGLEKERRQDAARNRQRIARAASRFSAQNRADMRAASPRSTSRRSKPKPSPRSTSARPSIALIRSVLKNLGLSGFAADRAERLLTEAKAGEVVRVGSHAVTLDGPGLSVHRSRSASETRSAALSVR